MSSPSVDGVSFVLPSRRDALRSNYGACVAAVIFLMVVLPFTAPGIAMMPFGVFSVLALPVAVLVGGPVVVALLVAAARERAAVNYAVTRLHDVEVFFGVKFEPDDELHVDVDGHVHPSSVAVAFAQAAVDPGRLVRVKFTLNSNPDVSISKASVIEGCVESVDGSWVLFQPSADARELVGVPRSEFSKEFSDRFVA